MDETLQKIRRLSIDLVHANTERWLHYGVFSYQWWLLLVFLIAPWLVWSKLADRRRLLELLLVGTLVIVVMYLIDLVGYHLNFWDYPIEIVPLLPGSLPFDLSMVPVPYMLLYQYLQTWRSYLIGLLGMTIVYAFIGEPLANWLQLVVYIRWSYLYSMFVYILTGILVRCLVLRLKGAAGGPFPKSKNQ